MPAPDFQCSRCGCVDVIVVAYPDGELPRERDQQLCTFCRTGHWHELFPREAPDREDIMANQPNGLGLG